MEGAPMARIKDTNRWIVCRGGAADIIDARALVDGDNLSRLGFDVHSEGAVGWIQEGVVDRDEVRGEEKSNSMALGVEGESVEEGVGMEECDSSWGARPRVRNTHPVQLLALKGELDLVSRGVEPSAGVPRATTENIGESKAGGVVG
jgi:hypothetical protein